jgi:hypothetical protein
MGFGLTDGTNDGIMVFLNMVASKISKQKYWINNNIIWFILELQMEFFNGYSGIQIK